MNCQQLTGSDFNDANRKMRRAEPKVAGPLDIVAWGLSAKDRNPRTVLPRVLFHPHDMMTRAFFQLSSEMDGPTASFALWTIPYLCQTEHSARTLVDKRNDGLAGRRTRCRERPPF